MGMEKENQLGVNEREQSIALPTPEKPSETYSSKCKKEAVQLPQKYRNLSEFFYRMTSSFRLLALCKKPPTFNNISRQVKVFTGRTFEHKHLAQIKYILPEAVNIDKILVHDQESLCMKPEMRITLTFDIVEDSHEESVFVALCHLFSSRLRNFVDKHSEDCDVPEAVLPVTYKQIDATINTDPLSADELTSTRTEIVKLSHFSPTYTPLFVKRAIDNAPERMQLTGNPLASPSSLIGDETKDEKKISVSCPKPTITENPVDSSPRHATSITVKDIGDETEDDKEISGSCPKPTITENPVDSSPRHVSASTVKDTPLKFVIETDKLMVETPAQSTPKRSSSTSEVKHIPLLTQACMSCNQPAKRSLDFSVLEEEDESSLNLTPGEAGKSKTSPGASTQTEAMGKAKVGICCSGEGDKDSYRCLPSDQEKTVSLAELVSSIQQIFMSVDRRAMTKEELFHKIIMSCEYDEEGQIEEQMEMLEKLVPGWICKQVALSGDLLYSIEKASDVKSILEAVASI